MKKILLFTILLLLAKTSYSQKYEIGFFAGGNNVIGDIGTNIYIAPYQPTFGGVFKWNKNERVALRADLYHSWTRSVGSSVYFPDDYQHRFRNGVVNGEVGIEWNILPYNLRYKRGKGNPWTPYMFVGIGGVMFEKIQKKPDGNYKDAGYGYGVSIPFGVGYKYAINHKLVLGADLMFRYVSSDNLDYSDTKKLGNLNTDDWFTTIGITLTYVFGRDACPCGQ